MAKRKKSGGLNQIISVLVIIVAIIAVMALVFEVLISPDVDTVSDKLSDKDYVCVPVSTSGLLGGLVGLVLPDNCTDSLSCVKDADASIQIFYFESIGDAYKYFKNLKDDQDKDSDTKIGFRGKAVYIATAEGESDFRKILF